MVTALDLVPGCQLTEERWHPCSFPAWYSWIWHCFSMAHGNLKKKKKAATATTGYIDFLVLTFFYDTFGQSPHSCFSLCFFGARSPFRVKTLLCAAHSVWFPVKATGTWWQGDLVLVTLVKPVQSNKCRNKGAAQGAGKGSVKISTGIFLRGISQHIK